MGSGDGERCSAGMSPTPKSGSLNLTGQHRRGGYERMHACGGAVVRAHCRSISSILLLITGSICCCSAVICCRIASGIPSWTASVTGSIVWAGLLPQRLRFRAAAGASESSAASSVFAPHRLRRLPSADSGAAAGAADSGAGGASAIALRAVRCASGEAHRGDISRMDICPSRF